MPEVLLLQVNRRWRKNQGLSSVNTLQPRLPSLSRWHKDHGFQDLTKSALVQRVRQDIRNAHNAPEKQARPVEFLPRWQSQAGAAPRPLLRHNAPNQSNVPSDTPAGLCHEDTLDLPMMERFKVIPQS